MNKSIFLPLKWVKKESNVGRSGHNGNSIGDDAQLLTEKFCINSGDAFKRTHTHTH